MATWRQIFILTSDVYRRRVGLWHVRAFASLGLAGLLAGCEESTRGQAVENRAPKPESSVYQDPFSPPSREGMTPEQIKFWDYLASFNRLPDNPSEEAVAIYHAKGIAPHFNYLEPSKRSVLGDLDGLKKHRELFPTRYPWVATLLRAYALEIPISAERFKGTAKEIGNNYKDLMETHMGCKASDETEKQFVAHVLEGLLVVDYVYARGSAEDRSVAHEIWQGVVTTNGITHPFDESLGESLIIPATYDIAWAAIADTPGKMWGVATSNILSGFRHRAPLKRTEFAKWVLLNAEIPGRAEKPEDDVFWGLLHNWRMQAGLRQYSIYALHRGKYARPQDSSWGAVIQSVFRIHFGTQHKVEYAKYRQLLDAAYPKIP